MTLAARADLPLEVDTELDSGGYYYSPWIDSAGMKTIIGVIAGGVNWGVSQVLFETSLDGVTRFTSNPWHGGDGINVTQDISARYWRIGVVGGVPNAQIRISVRVVD